MTTENIITIIAIVAPCIALAIWSLIKMYFQGKSIDTKMEELDAKFFDLDKELTNEIADHKAHTEKKLDNVYSEIKSTRDIIIRVETMCELLVGNKIKKGE